MRYRALGPITVEIDGKDAKLGGLRQQMVLAVLLRSANLVLSQDLLIDTVWSGEPPEAARATVQSYIYNLRRALGVESITRKGDGYVVRADASNFDVLAFEQAVETGLDLLEADPEAARTVLAEGLSLWFGTPYGGMDNPELNAEVQRLGEMRLTAIETRIDADLALGRDGELVAELESLVRDHPLRERFWAQLMLALYRSGRQAESLRAFQKARSRLIEDLGIEPAAELEQLEQRILERDPSLLLPERPVGEAPIARESARGYELRDLVGWGDHSLVYRAYQPSIGREVAVKVIQAEYANDFSFIGRFERDAQIVAGLEHPHILPLYDYWRDPSGAYLVMPLMRGGDLESALEDHAWNLEPALRLLGQVGDALSYAHRRGVLHRDLKAENVLLDEDGNACLSDFGLAKSHRDPEEPAAVDGATVLHTVRADVYALGALTFQVLTGVPAEMITGTLDLSEARPDLPAGLTAVIARATADDPASRFAKVDDYLREIRRAAGVDVVAGSEVTELVSEPTRNPYKGLRAFSEEDAIDFHGRSALIDELVQRVSSQRLVTVVGPSGSGKSSVVRAGLIPALRSGRLRGAREWLFTEMFPGSFPFEELEAALSRVAARAPVGMLGELAQPNGLLRTSKQILPGDDSTLLLVIDQFEELFSTVRSEETRRLFLENLIAVANDERSRVRIVLTMRADFLDRPLAYGDFAEALADGIVTIGPPTREGLAQAVAAPARTVGLELEPGLVARIIADVEGQPGALPLLQYALTEMFSHREHATLTIRGYEATGGVAGALGLRAEELFDGLSSAGRGAAREVFLRLVTVDEMGTVTRRRARQTELISLAVDRSGLEMVLNAFAGFRLLTFDRDPVTRGPTVEVAHEAILTEWARLRGWIEDARESLILARRVGEAAQEWMESHEDSSYLLRGVRLEDVETWESNASVVLTDLETRYIAASVEQRSAEVRSKRRRRRRTLVALSGGLILVSLLALVAFLQRGLAQHEALQARVRELASTSEGQLNDNPELALLIATEAFDMSISEGAEPNVEAVSAMAQAAADWRLVSRYPAGPLLYPVASPDGTVIAVSSNTALGDVNVFEANGSLVGTFPGPADPSVIAEKVAFSRDGRSIAVAYSARSGDQFHAVDGFPDLVIFDLANQSRRVEIDTDESWNWLNFSPDGTRLAVSLDQTIRVVDSSDGREIWTFIASAVVGEPRFLNNAEILVPLEGTGFTILSAADGSVVDQFEIPELNPDITAVNELGTHFAYRAGEHLRVIEIDTGEVVFDLAEPRALTIAIDAGATRFAYSGFDPNVYVLPIGRDDGELVLAGIFENVLSLAFVGQKHLLSYGEDALLWDVSPEGMTELRGIPIREPQWGYQISSDEQLLTYHVSTNVGGPLGDPVDGLRLVDLTTGVEKVMSQGEYNAVPAGFRLVSPDFTMVGSLTQDGVSTLRSLETWDVIREFDECRGPLAVTADNTRAVLSGWSCGTLGVPDSARSSVVDLQSGDEVFALPYQRLWSAEFNPPGTYEGGRYLAATDQVSVGIWDMVDGRLLGSLANDAHDEFGVILVITFDPTGRYLVGGTTGGVVWIADMQRVIGGEDMIDALVFNRQAHTGAAPVPAINGEGLVASAGFDGMVRLWDLESGNLILEFESDMNVPVVRFSPDGTELLYPHGLSIRRMPVDPYELRELAGELLTRDFLPDECARYGTESRCESLSS